MPELVQAIAAFQRYAEQDRQPGEVSRRSARRRLRGEQRLREVLSQRLMEHLERAVLPDELARAVDAVAARELDPYTRRRLVVEAGGSADRR